MPACTAASLVNSAKCFACLGDTVNDAVAIYLLCQWGSGVTPSDESVIGGEAGTEGNEIIIGGEVEGVLIGAE